MFVGTSEAAKRLGISAARLRVLLKEGRVSGAYKSGAIWLIPVYNKGLPIIVKRQRGPRPRWERTNIPPQSVINVNRHVISNNKYLMEQNPNLVNNKTDIVNLPPVFSVKYLKTNNYGHELQVNGPCRLVYRPDAPKPCGATVWIETFASVDIMPIDRKKRQN